MHFVPFLRLRADEDAEILGIDDAEMGEYAYDYVGIETELMPGREYGVNAVQGDSFKSENASQNMV
jgi:Amt family ammonium transporter